MNTLILNGLILNVLIMIPTLILIMILNILILISILISILILIPILILILITLIPAPPDLDSVMWILISDLRLISCHRGYSEITSARLNSALERALRSRWNGVMRALPGYAIQRLAPEVGTIGDVPTLLEGEVMFAARGNENRRLDAYLV